MALPTIFMLRKEANKLGEFSCYLFHWAIALFPSIDENGGAFHIKEGNLTLRHSEVVENQGKNGGGIYIEGHNATSSSLTVEGSTISRNSALESNGGGGVQIFQATGNFIDSEIS